MQSCFKIGTQPPGYVRVDPSTEYENDSECSAVCGKPGCSYLSMETYLNSILPRHADAFGIFGNGINTDTTNPTFTPNGSGLDWREPTGTMVGSFQHSTGADPARWDLDIRTIILSGPKFTLFGRNCFDSPTHLCNQYSLSVSCGQATRIYHKTESGIETDLDQSTIYYNDVDKVFPLASGSFFAIIPGYDTWEIQMRNVVSLMPVLDSSECNPLP